MESFLLSQLGLTVDKIRNNFPVSDRFTYTSGTIYIRVCQNLNVNITINTGNVIYPIQRNYSVTDLLQDDYVNLILFLASAKIINISQAETSFQPILTFNASDLWWNRLNLGSDIAPSSYLR